MKKKLCIIIPIAMIVIALLLAAVAAFGLLFLNGSELVVGRAVACGDDTFIFVDEEGGFWIMNDASASKNLFSGLSTGDKILVCRSSAMALSYPGQCAVRLCFKLEDGGEDDIPAAVLNELERIGFLK